MAWNYFQITCYKHLSVILLEANVFPFDLHQQLPLRSFRFFSHIT